MTGGANPHEAGGRVEEIRERRADITGKPSEPWHTDEGTDQVWAWTNIEDVRSEIARCHWGEDDAVFIAHAPGDIDTLLAEVERLSLSEKALRIQTERVAELLAEVERLRGALLPMREHAINCAECMARAAAALATPNPTEP